MLSDDLKGLADTFALATTDGMEITPAQAESLSAEVRSLAAQAEALEQRPVPDILRVNDAAIREGLYGSNVLRMPFIPVRVISGGRDRA